MVAARPSARAPSRSQVTPTLTPGSLASAAARFRPMSPQPMIANEIGCFAVGFMGEGLLEASDAFAGRKPASKGICGAGCEGRSGSHGAALPARQGVVGFAEPPAPRAATVRLRLAAA